MNVMKKLLSGNADDALSLAICAALSGHNSVREEDAVYYCTQMVTPPHGTVNFNFKGRIGAPRGITSGLF